MSILPSSPPRPLPYCWAHLQGHSHTVGPAPFPSKTRLDCAGPILALCPLTHLPLGWPYPPPLQGHSHTVGLTSNTVGPSSPPPVPCVDCAGPILCPSICLSLSLSVSLSVPSDMTCTGLASHSPLHTPPLPYCWAHPQCHTHTVGPSPPPPPPPPTTTPRLYWTHPISLPALWCISHWVGLTLSPSTPTLLVLPPVFWNHTYLVLDPTSVSILWHTPC